MNFGVEICVVVVLVYFAMKKKFDNFVAQFGNIPREPMVPFLGQGFHYMFKSPSEQFKRGIAAITSLGGTAFFVLGFNARIFMTDPKDIEKILSSRKLLVKADFYDMLKSWLGTGLLISNGAKWHTRRKITTPAFHFKILEDFVEVFDKNSEILVEKLKTFEGRSFDVFPLIGLCALDVICETSMGVEIHAQTNSESDYIKSVKRYVNERN